jgi:hypothetical protein
MESFKWDSTMKPSNLKTRRILIIFASLLSLHFIIWSLSGAEEPTTESLSSYMIRAKLKTSFKSNKKATLLSQNKRISIPIILLDEKTIADETLFEISIDLDDSSFAHQQVLNSIDWMIIPRLKNANTLIYLKNKKDKNEIIY